MKFTLFIVFVSLTSLGQSTLPGEGGTPIVLTNGQGPASISLPFQPLNLDTTNLYLDPPDFSQDSQVIFHWHNADIAKPLVIEATDRLLEPFWQVVRIDPPNVTRDGQYSQTNYPVAGTNDFTQANGVLFFRLRQFPSAGLVVPSYVVCICGFVVGFSIWKTYTT